MIRPPGHAMTSEKRKRPRGRKWREKRRKAIDRAGRRCERCGAAGKLQVHHKTPLCLGGAALNLGNLEALCPDCHSKAHLNCAHDGVIQ